MDRSYGLKPLPSADSHSPPVLNKVLIGRRAWKHPSLTSKITWGADRGAEPS
jgi:hypothetical protein